MLSLNAYTQESNSLMFDVTSLEMPRMQVIPLKDTENNRQYELYIKLPEGYSEEDTKKRYPVLFTTDAMWHIEILSAATEYIIEDIILVGISWQKDIDEGLVKEHGAHVSRFRDYSVVPSSNPEVQAKYQLGQANRHLEFIRNNVIQFVEVHYNTDPDKHSYFGYSAGGEFGTYALLSKPDTFKNYILGSPAIKGNIPFFTELASNTVLKNKGLNANVFISFGTLEKESGEYIKQLIDLLKSRNDQTLSLTYQILEGNHQTAFPLTGVQSVSWLAGLVRL